MTSALGAAALHGTLKALPFLNEPVGLPAALKQLMRAEAPSGGAALRGAIGGLIAQMAGDLGMAQGWLGEIGSTGNLGIAIGAEKTAADLIIFAHMDRPSFKVRDAALGELYPVCANRFPEGDERTQMKAMRYEHGRLIVGARGQLISRREGGRDTLTFTAQEGELRWYDILTLDAEPQVLDNVIHGTGLDNCLGVVAALGAAAALWRHAAALKEMNRRLLVVFTDHEEGNPEVFFGHGAARMAYAVPPPTLGVIISDTQGVNPDGPPVMGAGAGHGSVSAWGRGSFAPPQYLKLAIDRAEQVNALRPATVQMNTGYLSRSDDVPAFRWAKVLGMVGAPMTNAHTTRESAHLRDVVSAAIWLAQFSAAALEFGIVY